MDISHTLEPKSDQLDSVELLGGPRTFTITKVTGNEGDQPINVHLAEFPRPWRPGKSMRRVLAACWTADASTWVGRRVTLYCDESVRFGNEAVGGTRIAALSHIPKRKSIPLLVSKGRSAIFTVDPLPDAPPPSDADQSRRLFTLLADAGLGDKEAALTFISGQIGRDVASTKELSRDEQTAIVDALAAMLDPADTPAGDALFEGGAE